MTNQNNIIFDLNQDYGFLRNIRDLDRRRKFAFSPNLTGFFQKQIIERLRDLGFNDTQTKWLSLFLAPDLNIECSISDARFLIDALGEIRELTEFSTGNKLLIKGFLSNLISAARKFSINLGYYKDDNHRIGAFFDDKNLYVNPPNGLNGRQLMMNFIRKKLMEIDIDLERLLSSNSYFLFKEKIEEFKTLLLNRACLKSLYALLRFKSN
ncbi:MAG: hypothetical protein N2482_01855 [Patescibacteria group bacterium]|nr:hypothetical protein [Patescibacteria group bacterium]